MRILYVAMANDYGVPERGPSFEETNFRSSLDGMGHEVVPFDFMERARVDGKAKMRADLISTAAEAEADLAFFCLFEDELDPATLDAVRKAGGAPTVNWFTDDHWRFADFSRHMAPAFDLAVTTDPDAIPKYEAAGVRNVLLSQWACNRYAYTRVTKTIEHEVTFVGQPHGNRRETIRTLARAGIDVECWGYGWPAGRLSHDEMVRAFGSSRINLSLSNSSEPRRRERLALWLRGRRPTPRPPQIKGRNFEVPGCGGFLLTERVPHLERYFEIDREIAVFDDEDDLVRQVARWLEDETGRAAVADAGYRRVLAEHTYDDRFKEIFEVALQRV